MGYGSDMKLLLLPFLLVGCGYGNDHEILQKEMLMKRACEVNSRLSICGDGTLELPPPLLPIPPPVPAMARRRDVPVEKPQDKPAILVVKPTGPRVDPSERPQVGIDDREDRTHIHIRPQLAAYERAQHPERQLTVKQAIELQRRCKKIAPMAQANCVKTKTIEANRGRCQAYFRDCAPFLPKASEIGDMAQSWSSGVNLNLGSWNVKGIPYYPVNEEGAIGSGHLVGIPFGSWGGGFNQNIGVRDYVSLQQEAGANWQEGKYGYKNGWSVPLVQSLGVEGGQHNVVAVPLDKEHIGEVNIDNGYGVGGYYAGNDHVGVNWRRGDVQHIQGYGAPFAHAGFMTGQALTFPSVDTWVNALG
ncbi:unnamed protein product, partial [Mesorhabditis spiculigera]